jgi:hypothetical protein
MRVEANGLVESVDRFIDLKFNISLFLILIFAYNLVIRDIGRKLLLTIVLTAAAIIIKYDDTASAGEMAKIMALLGGLASVLAFLVAPNSGQARYLKPFTTFVNFAVYGNIVMMVGTPAAGTVRGYSCKFACLALFAWIVRYLFPFLYIDSMQK